MTRRWWFWPIYGLLLLGLVLAGAEVHCLLFGAVVAGTRPAADPHRCADGQRQDGVRGQPELVPSYNDWAIRDRPRSIARPPNVSFRSVLVGDSFLEGYYLPAPLAELVERRWVAKGLRGHGSDQPGDRRHRSPAVLRTDQESGAWRWTRTWSRSSSMPATT